jgi:hypothetical protein
MIALPISDLLSTTCGARLVYATDCLEVVISRHSLYVEGLLKLMIPTIPNIGRNDRHDILLALRNNSRRLDAQRLRAFELKFVRERISQGSGEVVTQSVTQRSKRCYPIGIFGPFGGKKRVKSMVGVTGFEPCDTYVPKVDSGAGLTAGISAPQEPRTIRRGGKVADCTGWPAIR